MLITRQFIGRRHAARITMRAPAALCRDYRYGKQQQRRQGIIKINCEATEKDTVTTLIRAYTV